MASARSAKGSDDISKKIMILDRLVREEKSYHVELDQQKRRILKAERDVESAAEGSDERANALYTFKQERAGLAQTEELIPKMVNLVKNAISDLQKAIDMEREVKSKEDINQSAIDQAEKSIQDAKKAIPELGKSTSSA